MHSIPSHLLALFLTTLTFLLLPDLTLSAETTLGPQGYASFISAPAFSILKPCAQGCLRYNGRMICGISPYADLGTHIGCGCDPQNYCFCDIREGPAVSSYIQSCVVTKCGTPTEESAVLDLYNGYCATANIAVATSSTKPYSFTGSTGADATSPPTSANPSGSKSNLSAATAANTNSNTAVPGENGQGVEDKKPVLGIGAIIGISVGGLVVLGALMFAGCCVFWRRRSSSKKAKKLAAAQAYTASQTQQPVETTYVPGKDGAIQIDGSGVFGAKPKPEEKVKPYVVSPLHTPTQGFAAPAVTQTPPMPNNGQHEMYASGIQQHQQHSPPPQQIPSPNAHQHEMYAAGNQQHYPPPQIPTPNHTPSPNQHEMYAHPQTPGQTPQELYTQANQSGGGYTTQNQQRGNWIAAQLPADQNQGGQYGYPQQQQMSPVQLPAGQDGIRSTTSPYSQGGGRKPVYEKP